MLAERIPEIQSALAEAGADGWFFACFQRNDPIGLDLLGLNESFKPKFLKRYAELAAEVRRAAAAFAADVRGGSYPDRDHSFE